MDPLSRMVMGLNQQVAQQAQAWQQNPSGSPLTPQEQQAEGGLNIVNGPGVPKPPTPDVYEGLQQLQQDHQTQLQTTYDDAKTQVDQVKNTYFENNHYELDATGNVKLDANGNPVVAAGKEDLDQYKARLTYLDDAKTKLQDQQAADNQKFYDHVNEVMKQYQTPEAMKDPNFQTNLQAVEKDFQAQEQQMLGKQKFDLLRVGFQNVPDVNNAIDQGYNTYTAQQQQFTQDEANSPQQKQIDAYTAAIHAYVAQFQNNGQAQQAGG